MLAAKQVLAFYSFPEKSLLLLISYRVENAKQDKCFNEK